MQEHEAHNKIGRNRILPYLRKYCRPARRFSRNLGLNLNNALLGGNSGTAALKLGNDWVSFRRKSSNSE